MANTTEKYGRGVVTGLVLGAATTFLLAPARREKIAHRFSQGTALLKEKFAARQNSASSISALDETLNIAQEASDEVAEKEKNHHTHDVIDSV